MNAQSRLKENDSLTLIREEILSCSREVWKGVTQLLERLIDQLKSVDDSEVATTGKFSLRKGVLMRKDIINKLTDLSDLVGTCGKNGSLQCDGDGLIALYNATRFSHPEITLEQLNQVCIKKHAMWFGGIGWFKMFKIKRVLKAFGIKVKFKGLFHSYNQLTNSYKFIIVYWQKGKLFEYSGNLKYQAGSLVKDKKNNIWLELYNPIHHYDSIRQFMNFEDATIPFLFTIN